MRAKSLMWVCWVVMSSVSWAAEAETNPLELFRIYKLESSSLIATFRRDVRFVFADEAGKIVFETGRLGIGSAFSAVKPPLYSKLPYWTNAVKPEAVRPSEDAAHELEMTRYDDEEGLPPAVDALNTAFMEEREMPFFSYSYFTRMAAEVRTALAVRCKAFLAKKTQPDAQAADTWMQVGFVAKFIADGDTVFSLLKTTSADSLTTEGKVTTSVAYSIEEDMEEFSLDMLALTQADWDGEMGDRTLRSLLSAYHSATDANIAQLNLNLDELVSDGE